MNSKLGNAPLAPDVIERIQDPLAVDARMRKHDKRELVLRIGDALLARFEPIDQMQRKIGRNLESDLRSARVKAVSISPQRPRPFPAYQFLRSGWFTRAKASWLQVPWLFAKSIKAA